MCDMLGSAGQWQPAITCSHQTGVSVYLSSDGLSLTVISRIHGAGGKLHPPVSLELLTQMPFHWKCWSSGGYGYDYIGSLALPMLLFY